MKLEHHAGFNDFAVVFKAWPRYFEAVAAGVKTAEARLLTSGEAFIFEEANAQVGVSHVRLENTESGETLKRRLSWFGEVGQVLGSSLYLFCWKEEP